MAAAAAQPCAAGSPRHNLGMHAAPRRCPAQGKKSVLGVRAAPSPPLLFNLGYSRWRNCAFLRCHLWPAKEPLFTKQSVPVQFDGVRCWLKRLYSDWIDNLVKGNRNALASVSRQCWPLLSCIRAHIFFSTNTERDRTYSQPHPIF